jgi:hypothetical protein
VSLRRIDPRFGLPSAPERVVVLGGMDDWRRGLGAVGIETDPRGLQRPDLVVAPAALARSAVALQPAAVIVEGRADRALAAAGFALQHFVARPTIEEPSLFVPLEQPVPASYAVRHWSVADRRWKQVRSTVAAALLERGRSLPLQRTITVATRGDTTPFLVGAARAHGIVDSEGWVLTLGQGDALSRNVFHLFPPGASAPAWILKFARVRGYADPFDRDEQGLAVASAAGVAAARAPRLLGRFVADGLHASIETAAVGYRMRELLQRVSTREGRDLIDGVASWIVELGRATAAPPDALTGERRRLLDEVVPRWSAEGGAASLVTNLSPLAAVAQHNDLGTWNVIVDGREFVAVDWESASSAGLPLWDLLYFLADALAMLDGSVDGATRHEHTRRLFRGELPSSRVLFEWIRRAVRAFAIPDEAVGAIATLCWLHHSLSNVDRDEVRARLGDPTPARLHGMEQMASTWLRDSALGSGWDRWRA